MIHTVVLRALSAEMLESGTRPADSRPVLYLADRGNGGYVVFGLLFDQPDFNVHNRASWQRRTGC